MTPTTADDLTSILNQRDELISSEPEFETLREDDSIENEAIRALGEIVIEVTPETTTFYSGT